MDMLHFLGVTWRWTLLFSWHKGALVRQIAELGHVVHGIVELLHRQERLKDEVITHGLRVRVVLGVGQVVHVCDNVGKPRRVGGGPVGGRVL